MAPVGGHAHASAHYWYSAFALLAPFGGLAWTVHVQCGCTFPVTHTSVACALSGTGQWPRDIIFVVQLRIKGPFGPVVQNGSA